MQGQPQWEFAAAPEWEQALERESVIRPLADAVSLTDCDVREATLRLGVCRSVFYKLLHRYKHRPQTSSLLPRRRGRVRGVKVLTPERENLLDICIRETWPGLEPSSLAALTRAVRRRFSERGLQPPNYRTVRRRMEALGLGIPTRISDGPKEVARSTRTSPDAHHRADLPLDAVQIDHTLIDALMVDPDRRLPPGRPWLTLAIDVATRAVLGFAVSREAPSSLAVSLVLSHAVLPKAAWLAGRGLQGLDWPMAGLPRLVCVENGAGFDSEAILRGCEKYGIAVEYGGLGLSHLGRHAERLIGTRLGEVALRPGLLFSRTGGGTAGGLEGREMTGSDLDHWLALQIAGAYHNSVHAALGKTPMKAWLEGLARTPAPVRFPVNAEQFLLDFLPVVPRRIRRDGIHLNKMRYWDSALSPWAGKLKEALPVKYDPRDLARVYVLDPSGMHWPVPCVAERALAIAAGSA